MKDLKWLLCLIWPHDWRMDTNSKRHCERCGKRMRRATWNWHKWLYEDSKW